MRMVISCLNTVRAEAISALLIFTELQLAAPLFSFELLPAYRVWKTAIRRNYQDHSFLRATLASVKAMAQSE
jgi:hypothetical protein